MAVVRAMCVLMECGYNISIPFTESAPYDLVVDKNGKLYRIQVRYTANKEVELRRIHSNSTGYVVKKTKDNAYDWLFVVTDDAAYLLKKCLVGRRSIAVTMLPILKKL